MFCTQCGQSLSEGARYCGTCGAPTAAPAARWAPTAAGVPAPPDPPAPDVPATTYEPPRADPPVVPPTVGVFGSPYVSVAPAHGGGAPYTAGTPAAFTATRYAGFWRRFWGLFIDRLALGVVLFPVGLLFGFNILLPFMHDEELTPERFMSLVFGSLSMWLLRTFAEWVYFSAFHSSARQATPGQMLMGLRVTGLDGGRIGYGRATARYFASWLSAALLLIGFIIGAFTERRQTLHDMIASTLVVRDGGTLS